ncbi:cobalt transporter, partial [Pseudomonas sp. BGM005]|nr:cobalt transporter [Pseudomonas sp. BG5]
AAVAWQFSRKDPDRWEKPTLRVIAVAFFALAAYVTASSGLALFSGERPEHSSVGLVLTAVSVLVMPFLSLAERRAGQELGS